MRIHPHEGHAEEVRGQVPSGGFEGASVPGQAGGGTRTTIVGEQAIVDEEHCPADGGAFVLRAFTTYAGQVYVFFTYDQPGNEAEMRDWFASLLQAVSFGA